MEETASVRKIRWRLWVRKRLRAPQGGAYSAIGTRHGAISLCSCCQGEMVSEIKCCASLCWEGHSTAQQASRAQGCAPFQGCRWRRSARSGCAHAALRIEGCVQIRSGAARAQSCTLPMPAWSCTSSFPTARSHVTATQGAALHRQQ